MAGYSPVPLPSLSTLFDPTVNNFAGAPAPLPSIGLVMNPAPAKTLTAAAGSFALTGVAATLKGALKLIEAAGSFSLTGVAATLSSSTAGGISSPAYLPSMSLVLERSSSNKLMAVSAGSFVLSGVASSLVSGLGMTADAGSFVLSGAPALRDLQVTSDRGTFALTGVAETLTHGNPGIAAGTGAFALTGIDAGFAYQSGTVFVLPGLAGVFVLTGNDATLPTTVDRLIVADRGTFAITGSAATMTYYGWSLQSASNSTWTDVTASTTTWTNA